MDGLRPKIEANLADELKASGKKFKCPGTKNLSGAFARIVKMRPKSIHLGTLSFKKAGGKTQRH